MLLRKACVCNFSGYETKEWIVHSENASNCVAGMLTSIQKFEQHMLHIAQGIIGDVSDNMHYSGEFHYMNWHDWLHKVPCWSMLAILLVSMGVKQVHTPKKFTSLSRV